jgi:hypothetical protein
MLQNLNTFIDSLAIATTITISFLFLPAIIELKKPKDAGPRLISENQIRIGDLALLADIEENQNTNYRINLPISNLLSLMNLEA